MIIGFLPQHHDTEITVDNPIMFYTTLKPISFRNTNNTDWAGILLTVKQINVGGTTGSSRILSFERLANQFELKIIEEDNPVHEILEKIGTGLCGKNILYGAPSAQELGLVDNMFNGGMKIFFELPQDASMMESTCHRDDGALVYTRKTYNAKTGVSTYIADFDDGDVEYYSISEKLSIRHVDEIPATCSETGMKEYYKGDDNRLYILQNGVYYESDEDSLVIEKLAHTVAVDDRKEPAFTKTGLTEGSHCLECGEVLIAQQVIPVRSLDGLDISVSYRAYVQKKAWVNWANDGESCGTVGQALRMETIQIKLSDDAAAIGSVRYRSYVQTYAWKEWVENGAYSGTRGEAKRLEAIQIELTGELAELYDIYYRVQAQKVGWTGWAKNGEKCGTSGFAYRLEAFEVKLVKKGEAGPTSSKQAYYINNTAVIYSANVQKYGWLDSVKNGAYAGTKGEALRMEAMRISLDKQTFAGDIEYRAYVQKQGWDSVWAKNGGMCGTTGLDRRLEAIQIRLTGDMAKHYDVYYRVYAQRVGWTGWAKNGEKAGTSGYAYRVEGVQVMLVKKDGAVPGSTENAYLTK